MSRSSQFLILNSQFPSIHLLSNFGFRICRPQSASSSRSPLSAWRCRVGPRREGRETSCSNSEFGIRNSECRPATPDFRPSIRTPSRRATGTRNLDVLATQNASSTVDEPQSASNNMITPTPRKASPGAARRGFPRAGGHRDGHGRGDYSHTPGILRLHSGQAPFTRLFVMTRKPTRRMRISPQPGQTVFSPGWPGTLPR